MKLVKVNSTLVRLSNVDIQLVDQNRPLNQLVAALTS